MRLPEFPSNPVPSSVGTAILPFEAAKKTTDVITGALQEMAGELARTQAVEATAAVVDRVGEVQKRLKERPVISAQEVRDLMGGDLARLPAEARDQLTTPSGEERQDVPVWAVGGKPWSPRRRTGRSGTRRRRFRHRW